VIEVGVELEKEEEIRERVLDIEDVKLIKRIYYYIIV
jgi:hypothetical protein